MITEKELGEYRDLCVSLEELNGKLQKKKKELRRLLEETIAKRKDALLVLAKANRLTRHLTGHQRQIAGFTYYLGEIKAKINQACLALPPGVMAEAESLPEIRSDCANSLELKQRGITVIKLIDGVKKKILQLELLELRCRELLLSIDKAMKAFRHESRIIRRKIYPFGLFSLIYRALRNLLGKTYFTIRDMEDLSALGNITGLVLKMADSPLI